MKENTEFGFKQALHVVFFVVAVTWVIWTIYRAYHENSFYSKPATPERLKEASEQCGLVKDRVLDPKLTAISVSNRDLAGILEQCRQATEKAKRDAVSAEDALKQQAVFK